MRERAELLDGMLDIESTPGAGTTVTVTIPLNHAQPARQEAAEANEVS
jgi:nitrate/nitrite-specific signal transduction histidine kinase